MSLTPRDLEAVLLERGGTACGDGREVRALPQTNRSHPNTQGHHAGAAWGKGSWTVR